jgi:hypothetical protein
MSFDLIATAAAEPAIARAIIERTASTPKVQQIVQLSLAPAFLLGGIGAIMNVMMSRLIWIAERIERIDRRMEDAVAGDHDRHELPWLTQRKLHAQRAVMLSTASAAVISVVIALLFVSAYIQPQIGTITAVAWVLSMGLLISGLGFFLLETRLAANGPVAGRARRRRKHRRADGDG